MIRRGFGILGGAIAVASIAAATTVPFTESFDAGAANWRNSSGAANANWIASGGADGGGYISQDFNFVNSVEGGPPVVLLRGQSNFGSSGNSFFGNWITDEVTEYSVWVRHDAPAEVTFFTRFATSAGFPGAFAQLAPVPQGIWTELTVAMDPNNPQFITFEGSDFATVFSDVGRIQIGVEIPGPLAGVDQVHHFDVDLVGIFGLLPGDADGDGCVDLSDLTILLSNFGNASGMTFANGDFDGDEDVDLSDLAALLANFGTGDCG